MADEQTGLPSEPISVFPVLSMVIEQMSSIAWQKLGLQHDPFVGGLHKNLPEARIAIDAVAALIPLLEPSLDESDKRQVQTLLRDLRVNYVNHSGGENS